MPGSKPLLPFVSIRIYASPRFWRLRSRLMRVRAAAALTSAQSSYAFRETRTLCRVLLAALVRVVATVALTLAFTVAVQAFGKHISDPTIYPAWLPSRLALFGSWLGEPPPATLNYQAIVAASIAVIGTLAAAYFATIAFVFSTTYKDATPSVRSLVTRLPGGRVYTFIYTQAALLALASVALPLADKRPTRLLLCVVLLLAGFVVLSFGRLRTQLYALLEPVRLLSFVRSDIARWTRKAAHLRNADGASSRRQICRSRTMRAIQTLRDLCYLIRDRERTISNVPARYAGTDPRLQTTARCLIGILHDYLAIKRSVEYLPGWCPQRQAHKDWLVAGPTEVEVALDTSTTLHPASGTDALWFERILSPVLAELIGGREVPQMSSILSSIPDPTRNWTSCGRFAEVRLWTETVIQPALAATQKAIDTPSDTASDSNGTGEPQPFCDRVSDEDAHLHNLVDEVALAYTQRVLGLLDYATSLLHEFPSWIVRHAEGEDVRPLGPAVSRLLNDVRDAIRFETEIEGFRITSDANIVQLVARAIAIETFDEASALMNEFNGLVLPWGIQVGKRGTIASGAALSRLDEALHKWEAPLSVLSKLYEHCASVYRDADDRWPDLDLSALQEQRRAMQRQLRLPIAVLAATVEPKIDSDRPDIFGWAFYRAHQDILEDLLAEQRCEPTEIEKRLRSTFIATDRATRRLQSTVTRNHMTVLGSVWSEPRLLLLQLSGIALVVSSTRHDDSFAAFERVWEVLLDADASRHTAAAIAAQSLDHAGLFLTPGKVYRSSRQLAAMRILAGERSSLDELEFGDAADLDEKFGSRIARMLQLASNGDFESVFLAAWLIPEALRRGVDIQLNKLGRLLRDLFEDLAPMASEDSAGGDQS